MVPPGQISMEGIFFSSFFFVKHGGPTCFQGRRFYSGLICGVRVMAGAVQNYA